MVTTVESPRRDVFALVWAGIFFACAVVQWNDPDPARWIGIYLAAGGLAVAAVFRRLSRVLAIGVAIASSVWAATLVPTILSGALFSGNEVEREFGGLLLVSIGVVELARRRAGTRSELE